MVKDKELAIGTGIGILASMRTHKSFSICSHLDFFLFVPSQNSEVAGSTVS